MSTPPLQALIDFLKPFRISGRDKDAGVAATHVMMHPKEGKFSVPYNQLDTMYALYTAALRKNVASLRDGRTDDTFGLLEMRHDMSMFVMDFDITRVVPPGGFASAVELHSAEDVDTIAGVIYDHIVEKIDCVGGTTNMFDCFYLTKAPYIKGDHHKKVSHGFHLAFPDIFLTIRQEKGLIEGLKDKLRAAAPGLFATADVDLDMTTGKTRSPWLMYGSSKSPHSGTYLLQRAYRCGAHKRDIKELLSDRVVYNAAGELVEEVSPPRIFSTYIDRRMPTALRNASAVAEYQEIRKIRNTLTNVAGSKAEFDAAEVLTAMLSEERATARNTWIEVCWALYNITHGTDKGLELFDRFSQMADNYCEKGVRSAWATSQVRENGLGMGSLCRWASEDSPGEYAEWKKNRVDEAGIGAITGGTYDVAMLFQSMYPDTHKYSDKVWWRHENHAWVEMRDGPASINLALSEEVYKAARKIVNDAVDNIRQGLDPHGNPHDDIEDVATSERFIKRTIDRYRASIARLRNIGFKSSVVQELQSILHENNFRKKLGANRNLLGVANGVLDFTDRRKPPIFRDGFPTDNILHKTPVIYRDFEPNDPLVVRTLQFFEKVLPNAALREYFLSTLAETLIGGNSRKHLQVWTGCGDNGKSVCKTLVQKMLGPYVVDFPCSMIFGTKAKPGQPLPELARASNGVRVAFVQESNTDDKVNTGMAKELTGNDTMFVRTLFKEGGEMTNHSKLILICNMLPQMTTQDQAMMNRLKIIKFEARFVDTPPESVGEQIRTRVFAKDDRITDTMDDMAAALLYLLVQRLPMVPAVLPEPRMVKEVSEKYWQMQNTVREWQMSSMPVEEGGTASLIDAFRSYREWCRGIGRSPMVMEEVGKILCQIIGEYDDREARAWNNRRVVGNHNGY